LRGRTRLKSEELGKSAKRAITNVTNRVEKLVVCLAGCGGGAVAPGLENSGQRHAAWSASAIPSEMVVEEFAGKALAFFG
jgi:hypothetical protein